MSTPSNPMATKRSPRKRDDQQRVILLLDMDCFYAQCETVRLGLDPEIPLALIQWNSALAVSYPARKFGIVRGDSFEKIREKSKGECVCIHLPVTALNDTASPLRKHTQKTNSVREDESKTNEEDNSAPFGEDDIKASYNSEFNQSAQVRDEMYAREKNRMRSKNEGKACLDRYRLASARIFSLIDETLSKLLGKKNYILERASIDELFIDVSAFCNNPEQVFDESGDDHQNDAKKKFCATCQVEALKSLNETMICDEINLHPAEMKTEKALVLGCHVARTVRRAVFDELRFTLSAGISNSKLVAKLGATYGKPNGQAVIFPGAITKVMNETQIKKARMLGGKLGKRVLSLLPENETTMGSISRLLSLDDLIRGVGEEPGRWVFDACRGICSEEVKSTLKVLPKSITAFKSFSGVGYPELEKWTELLATDIMKRVELDSGRNNRTPKSCTLGYTIEYGGPWIGRSVRLPFPTDRDFDARVKRIVSNTRKVLTESGCSTVIRLGYSAIDFVTRPAKGIESFFAAEQTQKSSPKSDKLNADNKARQKSPSKSSKINVVNKVKQEGRVKPNGIEAFFSQIKDIPTTGDHNWKCSSNSGVSEAQDKTEDNHEKQLVKPNCHDDIADVVDEERQPQDNKPGKQKLTDEEIARELQKSYDKEINPNSTFGSSQPRLEIDKDQAMALKLQSKYDREHAVLSCVEKFSANSKRKGTSKTNSNGGDNVPKKSKIDSYFLLKNEQK